ncbi:MAG: DUF2065 domain-containing protein [Thermodesulfobacteriota bacterium]
MKLMVTVLGLVFVLEAIPYVLFPEAMKRWLAQVIAMSSDALRTVGLISLALGLLLCYLTQRTTLIP